METAKKLELFLDWVDKNTHWKTDKDIPNHLVVSEYLRFLEKRIELKKTQAFQLAEKDAQIKFWKQQDQNKLIKISELAKKLRDNGFLNETAK
jgi:hypothetical protein